MFVFLFREPPLFTHYLLAPPQMDVWNNSFRRGSGACKVNWLAGSLWYATSRNLLKKWQSLFLISVTIFNYKGKKTAFFLATFCEAWDYLVIQYISSKCFIKRCTWWLNFQKFWKWKCTFLCVSILYWCAAVCEGWIYGSICLLFPTWHLCLLFVKTVWTLPSPHQSTHPFVPRC